MSAPPPPSGPVKKVFNDVVKDSIRHELACIWAAHHAVGLKGQMCLYTLTVQEPWRSKEAGLIFWFGPDDTEKLLPEIERLYNEGNLPNSPLLLNPLVHDDDKKPIGSGIVWATGFALGVEKTDPTQTERIKSLNAFSGGVERGGLQNIGLKIVGFSATALKPLEDNMTVDGCRELFEIANFVSDLYAKYYLLSGLDYLGKHGGFAHRDFHELIPKTDDLKKLVASHQIKTQFLKDAFFCWKSYDRHHSLYVKFGVAPGKVENNLKFYNYCGRDVELFDACGAKHSDANTSVSFDFLVKGWLPRGAVTLIGGGGGCGKSSLAHALAIKAAIDWRPDEPTPTWLGSEVDLTQTGGISVYFAGEDSPAIVQARSKVFDPEGRAQRFMFQRTEFGEGGTLSTFLMKLRKLPEVPLIVIDPARKYLSGDEEDANVVSEFFEAIEEFAIRKNTAMLVVHHLAKGAKPKNVLDIYDMLRGSQVFIDRARVVIGMYREGPMTVAGLAKNNIPPQLGMIAGERIFARDAEKLELVQLPGEKGIRGATLTPEQIAALADE